MVKLFLVHAAVALMTLSDIGGGGIMDVSAVKFKNRLQLLKLKPTRRPALTASVAAIL